MRDRKKCTHEVVQISQDGENVILCGDCGWEFGHIGRGNPAEDGFEMTSEPIFHAYVEPGHPVVVVARKDEELTGFAVGVTTTGDGIATGSVQPCAACKWDQGCEACHS